MEYGIFEQFIITAQNDSGSWYQASDEYFYQTFIILRLYSFYTDKDIREVFKLLLPMVDYNIMEQLMYNKHLLDVKKRDKCVAQPETYALNSHFSPKPINPHVRKFSNTSHLVITLN